MVKVYYLSDVLSCMETGVPLHLHSSGVPIEGSTGVSVPSEIPLPENLYLVGTINVDETTNPVSDKVLDRAMVLDMSVVDITGFLVKLGLQRPELIASRDACRDILVDTHQLLVTHGLGFGYRVAKEVIQYQAFAELHLRSTASTSESFADDLMVQKVLVKLRGSERQRSLLNGLKKVTQQLPKSQLFLDRLLSELDEYGSFQASR